MQVLQNGSWFWTLFAFQIGITGNIKCINSWDHRLGPSCWDLCRPFSAGAPWPSFVCSHSKAEEAIDRELKWLKHHSTQTRASQACWAPKHTDKCVCVCLRRIPCGIIHPAFSALPLPCLLVLILAKLGHLVSVFGTYEEAPHGL